jgi:hypothetical protein
MIRFRDKKSAEVARANIGWLEELGNGIKLVKARFRVVIHRLLTKDIVLPENKKQVIEKITEQNKLGAKGYVIKDIA